MDTFAGREELCAELANTQRLPGQSRGVSFKADLGSTQLIFSCSR
jgi:hypothetical protein